jgi:hypothetical protein
MTVLWQLEVTTDCEISWGLDSNYSLGSALTTEYGTDHQHSYTISGLTPGTKYYYKVVAPVETIEASFRSAPPDTDTELKFFMFGDTRTNYLWHDSVSSAMIADYQEDELFQTISVCTGDLVKFGAVESEWQTEFFTEQAPAVQHRLSELPFVSCLGNHGLYYNNYSGLDTASTLFGKYFPFPYVERRYWSFDYGPVHFTIADLYPPDYDPYGQGLLDDEQLEWIENDLSNTDKEWKIVVIHEPGWSAGGSSSGAPHPNNENVQDLLQPLLEQYGVQILQCGHNHYYAHAVRNGILHLTAAGGGAPLYSPDPLHPYVMKTREEHHYCKAEINGDEMQITVLSAFGDTIDMIEVFKDFRPSHLLGFITLLSEGVENVMVEVNGQVTHPDEIGYYGIELAPGTYDVSFSLNGYISQVHQVEILEGTETQLDIELSVGLQELTEISNISFFPNPVSDYLTVDGVSNMQEIEVCIYNLSGQLTLQGQTHQRINVSELPKGIYIIEARMKVGIVMGKFVKQ